MGGEDSRLLPYTTGDAATLAQTCIGEPERAASESKGAAAESSPVFVREEQAAPVGADHLAGLPGRASSECTGVMGASLSKSLPLDGTGMLALARAHAAASLGEDSASPPLDLLDDVTFLTDG